ncbi:FliC family flagellar biosynthesis protein [Proteus hauseri ATCC 700826]|uniref:Flagellin n=1 Tax=Proteus hauseri ATCC 700826 TaxID=1354271 RepID=A0AAJ3LTV3_PROHU|nr:flagellin FliC [Proteus hauseri]OAT46323.1 FliC family flagellar biosynthesis protein [Proteus hauseri ATCC 700826]
MAQVINTNVLSLVTQNNLNRSQSKLGTAIQRLSSGLRINSAKDDAAGQAISNRFTANIQGLTQAARNANDGISISQTTEGALNEINNNLLRVRELTVQAKNGSNSESDIKSIQEEINQRTAEINRISEQTQFNGVKVLSEDSQLNLQVGALDKEQISVNLKKMDATTLGIDTLDLSKPSQLGSKATQVEITPSGTPSGPKEMQDLDTQALDDKVSKGTLKSYDIYYDKKADGTDDKEKIIVHTVDSKGVEGYLDGTLAAGAAKGKTKVDASANVTKKVDPVAEKPLKRLDDALAQVDSLRSSMGAVQNRLESTVNNLNNTVANLTAANSRIQDADYATEVSNMSKGQILQQAGTAVLAQANQMSQNVLSLLR